MFFLVYLALATRAMAISMEAIMAEKRAQWKTFAEAGLFDQDRYQSGIKGPCIDGKVSNFSCHNIDMMDYLTHGDMGGGEGHGSDIWGWTSTDGREIALVGQSDGTTFLEVGSNGELKYLGRLNVSSGNSAYRGIKVIGSHAYIGSEHSESGLQVFDLEKVLSITDAPVIFHGVNDLTAWYKNFGSSHNIVANEATDMIYAVGTSGDQVPECAGGLYMLNVSDPRKPWSPGCVHQDGYVHDAQCVIYTGPDSQYVGHEICFGYDAGTLTIFDVTNKSNPHIISTTDYKNRQFVHQGWLVDDTMRYLLLGDEYDELLAKGPAHNYRSTTYIFDISSLSSPKNTGLYQSPANTIDHNQYVINGLAYQANYASGLRIVDVSSVSVDPTGKGFEEVAYFDVYPDDDADGGARYFIGAWGAWPFFKSGYLLINSIERGVFSVKFTGDTKALL